MPRELKKDDKKMEKIEDKIAIVTGGTGALGRHVVNKLAGEGVKVYVPAVSMENFNSVFDKSQDENQERFELRKIFSFVCDATDESSVVEFVRSVSALENGKIDYLINTVGTFQPDIDLPDMTSADLEKMYRINFLTTFYFSREVLKVMEKNEYGRVFAIGGMAGLETTPKKFAYSMSKAAVINLMNTISAEMKSKNIRANTIVPGVMDTPENREWGSKEDIKTWVKPSDIAEIIWNLLGESSSPIRESVIKVYGSY